MPILHDCAVRHFNNEIDAVRAVAVRAFALLSVARLAYGTTMEVEQRRGAGVDLEEDVAAPTAVTAVWTAEGLELLTVDRGAAVPTVAGVHPQRGVVSELRHVFPPYMRKAGRKAGPPSLLL
jgi:hypothetical protein